MTAAAALPRMFSLEFVYELRKQLRNKSYAFAVLGFPIMFYLLFGVANRHNSIDGQSVAKYLIAGYSVFGMMGSALFGVGAGMAFERGQGWLDVKRASPMPPAALLVAKCGSAMCFAVIVSLLLMACGAMFVGVHLSALESLKLLGIVAAGTIPFAALGLSVSFLISPTAAPGIMNLIYLPLSFCSGLWIPIMFLPKWMQHFAPVTPSYHLGQLAFSAVGFPATTPAYIHWLAIAAATAVFVGAAAFLYRRSTANG